MRLRSRTGSLEGAVKGRSRLLLRRRGLASGKLMTLCKVMQRCSRQGPSQVSRAKCGESGAEWFCNNQDGGRRKTVQTKKVVSNAEQEHLMLCNAGLEAGFSD